MWGQGGAGSLKGGRENEQKRNLYFSVWFGEDRMKNAVPQQVGRGFLERCVCLYFFFLEGESSLTYDSKCLKSPKYTWISLGLGIPYCPFPATSTVPSVAQTNKGIKKSLSREKISSSFRQKLRETISSWLTPSYSERSKEWRLGPSS